jgi:hypothetical protein
MSYAVMVTPTGTPLCGTTTWASGCRQITVSPDNTLNRTSAVGTDAQTVCINTAITPITYATTGATGATVTNLPTGISGVWAGNVVTISGTPTVAGAALTYTVTLTGGCGSVNATGTITVTPNNTAGAASSTPTLCINTLLTNITHATTVATGIGAAAGLPAGVSAAWAANVITISGTPSASGTFNYSIPLTGGCGSVNATGTITVTPDNTAGAASSTPTLCINTLLTNITPATTIATGIGAAVGLPAGVSAAWAANVITISGTPSTSGTFNYSIPLTGGCGSVNATGTITVTPSVTINAFAMATSTRCQGAGVVTYTTTANNSTGITYILDVASLAGGNTINAATGDVTYVGAWSGTTTITASAAGCNGPALTTHVVTIYPLPTPSITGPVNVCENDGEIYVTTNNAGNSYNWTVSGGIVQAGQGTNSVTILWDTLLPSGTLSSGGIISVTETTPMPAGCSDISPDYNVTIYRVPQTGPQHHIINSFKYN